jgi:hypothetical protein
MTPKLTRTPRLSLVGHHPDLRGDCSGLRGDCSNLWGNCSGLRGDCSGRWGNCSNLWGDLDECGIAPKDRATGIDIATLVTQ